MAKEIELGARVDKGEEPRLVVVEFKEMQWGTEVRIRTRVYGKG